MARTKTTDTERAQRRQADRDRLEQAARALLTSDGWQRWVKVRSTNGLARYSFGNQILIALQRPDATYVAGFRAFLQLNRCVRKGERAIRILAPMSIPHQDSKPAETQDAGASEQQKRTVFRAVPVFDTLSRDRVGGFSSGAAERLETLNSGGELGRVVAARVRSPVGATSPGRHVCLASGVVRPRDRKGDERGADAGPGRLIFAPVPGALGAAQARVGRARSQRRP
jgi:hypothetical protein